LLARAVRLVLSMLLLLGLAGSAQADTGDAPRLDRPAAAAVESAPHDAPRLGSGRLSPTPPPNGFNAFDGGWIRFYYHPSIRERVQPLIEESTLIRRELTERLGTPVLSNVRVDIARTPGEMQTLAPPDAPFPDYAAGVAYSEIDLVLLTIAPVHPTDQHDLVQVFRHELAHIALSDAVGGQHVPRWFNEGFAVLASNETSFTRLQTLWTATIAETLIPLERLDRGFPADESTASIAYAESVDVVRFLVREREQYRFHGLVERLRGGEAFNSALLGSYSIDLAQLEQEWREDVAKRYTFFPVLFSGTVIWAGILALFVWGWRKRRARMKTTLKRWAHEEAREDQLRARASRMQAERVHIVLARAPQEPSLPPAPPPPPHEAEVPRVQHEGQWHTLH
jgi:hypothetical protein